jgi:hypothetical protein
MKILAVAFLLAAVFSVGISARTVDDANLGGKWNMVVIVGEQYYDLAMEIEQTDSDFKGSVNSVIGSGTLESGKVTGNTFKGQLKGNFGGQDMVIDIDGKMEDEKLSGTMSAPGLPAINFTATRVKS